MEVAVFLGGGFSADAVVDLEEVFSWRSVEAVSFLPAAWLWRKRIGRGMFLLWLGMSTRGMVCRRAEWDGRAEQDGQAEQNADERSGIP